MKKAETIALAIILLSYLVGIYFYSSMPSEMASHWNLQGQVDGYISKFWGLFLMPIVSTGLFLLFLAIPQIDPLKENIKKFRGYFDAFIILLLGFLFYLYLLTILWNKGARFDMIQVLSPAFAALFGYLGILLEKAKRNWFIGIRTPWTMSSDKVWDKTHKLGALLFKVAGAICLLGILFPNFALFFVFLPLIVATFYTTVYSYLEYRKEAR